MLDGCQRPIAARTLVVVGRRDPFYSEDLFPETADLTPTATCSCSQAAATSAC
jgi:hypothetical protein